MNSRTIPKFSSETEEANWWFDRREQTAKDILEAVRIGRVGPGARARYASMRSRHEQFLCQEEEAPTDRLKNARLLIAATRHQISLHAKSMLLTQEIQDNASEASWLILEAGWSSGNSKGLEALFFNQAQSSHIEATNLR